MFLFLFFMAEWVILNIKELNKAMSGINCEKYKERSLEFVTTNKSRKGFALQLNLEMWKCSL